MIMLFVQAAGLLFEVHDDTGIRKNLVYTYLHCVNNVYRLSAQCDRLNVSMSRLIAKSHNTIVILS